MTNNTKCKLCGGDLNGYRGPLCIWCEVKPNENTD